MGWGCRGKGVRNLSLLGMNAGFIFSRLLWFQCLICSDIGGLYLQFLMANKIPGNSSEVPAPVGMLQGRPCRGGTEGDSPQVLGGSILCLCLRGQAVKAKQESLPQQGVEALAAKLRSLPEGPYTGHSLTQPWRCWFSSCTCYMSS